MSTSSCTDIYEKTVMFHIYQTLDNTINEAVLGTNIDPSYLAALISLESQPPGNWKSKRFEPGVYRRLYQLKHSGKAFGGISRELIYTVEDEDLKKFATSYGLTQIMGYHCLSLGCKISELRGKNHLLWAVKWMTHHYGKKAILKDWSSCFRIHNTGHPKGTTSRKDYVSQGLSRMKNYKVLQNTNGDYLQLLFHSI